MSSVVNDIHNPEIDKLVQSSKYIKWIPHSEIIKTESSQIDNIYYAIRKHKPYREVRETPIMLLLLGSNEECTPTLVSEFARIYSLPTHKHTKDLGHFRRYFKWLENRNKLIKGFTKYDGNYYMLADKLFYYCYSRYGFCSKCGILRCSPVWCICGHKQLSNGWTSNNKRLDEFIRKSQLQTNSPNHAYLEWIPFDIHNYNSYAYFDSLPICECPLTVRLIPLEITDETHDSYYAELCDKHPDILATHVWLTIGFTYNASEQKYFLIKLPYEDGLCLACAHLFISNINAFCYHCKAPRLLDWTTGNKSLDSFIMESWNNIKKVDDAYIQWIEYSLLTNVQQMPSLCHGCTHVAEWSEQTTNELTRVTLKKIVNKGDDQLLDFYQLTKEYPEILTRDNIWIIGIAQEPSTREYYLVFYYDVQAILDRLVRDNDCVICMQYSDFYEFKEIGSGSDATVYTAKYRKYLEEGISMQETVALKRFKSFDKMPELLISEFKNHACGLGYSLAIYGVTQISETKEYMIVMQYANNGSLLSYLDRNINKLTWKDKLLCLQDIANRLSCIHRAGLVHCDIHGGNILMHEEHPNVCIPFICDFRSVNSHESNSIIRGVLPFIAPEVFRTRKFTQKSDIYSFGIIMYLMATGEPPFGDRHFDASLIREIMDGLRPSTPDSAPDEYTKLAEWCCDDDPDNRPRVMELLAHIHGLL